MTDYLFKNDQDSYFKLEEITLSFNNGKSFKGSTESRYEIVMRKTGDPYICICFIVKIDGWYPTIHTLLYEDKDNAIHSLTKYSKLWKDFYGMPKDARIYIVEKVID